MNEGSVDSPHTEVVEEKKPPVIVERSMEKVRRNALDLSYLNDGIVMRANGTWFYMDGVQIGN